MILDGRELSKKINTEIKQKIEGYCEKHEDVKPGLGVIIVGDRKDSLVYVNMKRKKCEEIGIESKVIQLSENSSTENILGIVKIFNSDPTVHGILVQLPLPKHVNEEIVLAAVDIDKDVDGFHASNMGNLAMERRTPLFTPCTPLGCLRLIDEYKIPLQGKNVVVIGKSNIVGLPISLMMMKRNATVTVCNVHTDDLQSITQRADIIVSACGQGQMVRGDWVKDGVVIIDIGINHIQDPEHPDKPEKKENGWRCAFRGSFRKSVVHHTSSRWCWTNDCCDAYGEYVPGFYSTRTELIYLKTLHYLYE